MTEQKHQDDSTQGEPRRSHRDLAGGDQGGGCQTRSARLLAPRNMIRGTRYDENTQAMWELCVHESGHLVSNAVCGFPIVAVVVRPDRSGCVWADRPSGTAEEIRKKPGCALGWTVSCRNSHRQRMLS